VCAYLGSLIFLLIVAAYCDHRDWLCQPGAWGPRAKQLLGRADELIE